MGMEAVAMSVINNMLKNIEQREAKQITDKNTVEVNIKPIYDIRNVLFKALIILIVLSVIFVAYLYLPTAEKSKKPQQELTVTLTSSLPETELAIKKDDNKALVTDVFNELEMTDLQAKELSVESINENDIEPSSTKEPIELVVNKLTTEAAVIAKQDELRNVENADEVLSVAKTVVIDLPKPKPVKAKSTNKMTKSSTPSKSQDELIAEQLTAAKQAIQFGLYDEAISDLNNILLQSSKNIDARNLLASAYFQQQDINSAQQVLQVGISQNPDVLEWRIMLSKILIMQQQYKEVLLLLSEEFEVYANLDFWVLQGTAAQSINQHTKALNSFRHLTQLQPSQAKWWLALATSKDALGEYPDAKHLYKVALDLGGLNTAMTQHALQRLVALKEVV